MKKIMVYAYTRFNFGDDLMVKMLCERYPDTTFVLHAPKAYKRTFKSLKNVQIHPSDTLFIRGLRYILSKLQLKDIYLHLLAKKCDAAIHIGGSLFIQQADWKQNIKATKAMRIKGKPFFLVGANFGPFANEAFYRQHQALFKTYTDICFRERHSYDLFKELKYVRVADDIVFQLKQKDLPTQVKSIVISVIKPSIRKHLAGYDALYYQKMREIAIYFIGKGYHVILMSFCEVEKDDEAIEKIVQNIPPDCMEHVTKHFYQTNIEETLQLIASSRFVVATRFHAMIVGWAFHKSVFPIVYSTKMSHVLEDIEFKGGYSDFTQLNVLAAEEVFADMRRNAIDVSKQAQHAAKQFAGLDAFLKG